LIPRVAVVGRVAAAVVILGVVACAPRPFEAPVNESRIPQDRRTIYSLDWRAQVSSDWVEGPPVRLEQLTYEPLETVTPLVLPTGTGTEIVAGSNTGSLIAFDARGKKRWAVQRPGPLRSGLAGLEGRIYFGSADGTIAAVNAETGQQLWSYDTGEEPGTTPVISGGLILVSTHEQTLFALDAATGQWRWQYHRDQPKDFTIRGVSTPLVINDRLFVGFADGAVVCLRLADGALLWQVESHREHTYLDSDSAPQTDGQRIFATSYREGVLALSPDKGNVLWQKAFPQVNHLAFSRGTLYATAVGRVGAFAPSDGTQLWARGTGNLTATALEAWKGLLMVPTDGPLFFLDGRAGRTLGDSFNPGRGISAAPAIYGRSMYVMSNAGWLYAMTLR
jgi:outer membrane protein assembly factor BamB